VFETFCLFSTILVKLLDLYYSVYPGPSETVRGSNFYCSWFYYSVLPFVPFVIKRESKFYFWTGNVFPNRSSDFCPRMVKGGICLVVIGYILFRQNHLYVKMLFNRDSTIQKCLRKFCTVNK
jgi:hypothetical protein